MIDQYSRLSTIMHHRWRMLVNGTFHAGRQRRAWAIIIAVLIAGVIDLSYKVSGQIFSIADADPSLLVRPVAGGLALLCGFTAISSVTFALSSLYFAKDLDGLLSSPLPPRVLLMSRMLTQLGLGVGVGAVIVGPPLLAYTVSVGRAWAFFPIGFVTACLAAIPLALATGLVVAGVRLVPARYVRGAGGIIVTLAVFGVTAINLLLRGADAFTIRTAGSVDLAGYGRLSGGPWQPIGWASRSAVGWASGDWPAGVLWALPVGVVAVLCLVAVAWAGEVAFVRGYQRSSDLPRRRRNDRSRSGLAHARDRVGPLWLALAAKDAREIRRDASQLTQLVLPLIIFALYIGSPGRNPGELSATSLPGWYGTALTAAFASLFSAAGIPLRAVGTEGEKLWLLRSAPISSWTVLLAKYAVGFAVAFGLGGLLLGLGEWRGGMSLLAAVGPMLLFAVIIAGLVAMAIGLGAMHPRLDWADPRRAIGLGTSLAFLGIGATYLTVCFICLAVPYAAAPGSGLAIGLGVLALLLVAAATGSAALYGGGRRLAVLEA